MNERNDSSPSEETLRHQLSVQWQDHIQTRNQTWKTLQAGFVLLAAVVIADINLSDPWLLILLAAVLAFASIAGIAVTIHHRKVELQKFGFISVLEEKLMLHQSGYMNGTVRPSGFKWQKIFNLKRISTPAYILIIHCLLLLFALIYIILRVTEKYNPVQP